jgi:hypothetical protein
MGIPVQSKMIPIVQRFMIDRMPYTYLIECVPTNQYYYGVRTAKGCLPEDLLKVYFTSSKRVHWFIGRYGIENFRVVHTLKHTSKGQAKVFESVFLHYVNASGRKKWLNATNTKSTMVPKYLKHPTNQWMLDKCKEISLLTNSLTQ